MGRPVLSGTRSSCSLCLSTMIYTDVQSTSTELQHPEGEAVL